MMAVHSGPLQSASPLSPAPLSHTKTVMPFSSGSPQHTPSVTPTGGPRTVPRARTVSPPLIPSTLPFRLPLMQCTRDAPLQSAVPRGVLGGGGGGAGALVDPLPLGQWCGTGPWGTFTVTQTVRRSLRAVLNQKKKNLSPKGPPWRHGHTGTGKAPSTTATTATSAYPPPPPHENSGKSTGKGQIPGLLCSDMTSDVLEERRGGGVWNPKILWTKNSPNQYLLL